MEAPHQVHRYLSPTSSSTAKYTKLFDDWAVCHQNWWECTWHTYTWSYGGAKLSDQIIGDNDDFPLQDIWSQSWKTGTSQMEGSRPGRQGNETRKQFAIYPSIFASCCVFCKVEVISFSKHPNILKIHFENSMFYIDFPETNNFWEFLKNWKFYIFSRKIENVENVWKNTWFFRFSDKMLKF